MKLKSELAQRRISLREWETVHPTESTQLRHFWMPSSGAAFRARQFFEERGAIEIGDLREGTSITARSFVGDIRIGTLQISIRPKISWLSVLKLVEYSYGLRPMSWHSDVELPIQNQSLIDLLMLQLCWEVQKLVAVGIRKDYLRANEILSWPRGRIDFRKVPEKASRLAPGLPCITSPRTDDIEINRALRSGLEFARKLTVNRQTRLTIARTVGLFNEQVRPMALTESSIEGIIASLDRLTERYRPALSLVQLLYLGAGTAFAESDGTGTVPSFVFDMNRLFQMLIARFLREHLDGYQVREERVLRGMITYKEGSNPRNRTAPQPRPDFAITRSGNVVAILDAKYRDLWETKLPREMLYQLSIYALSQPLNGEAAILYPTVATSATAQILQLRDPLTGGVRNTIALRPVSIPKLEKLLEGRNTVDGRNRCRNYARHFALPNM